MSRPTPPWTPPMRDGVSASRVAVTAGPWRSMAEFLAARMPRVVDWPQRLARGEVLDARGRIVASHSPCCPGEVLWYWRSPPPEARVPFELEVLHQDDQLVVVDKPHSLAVAPVGRHLHETVLVRLKQLLGIETLVPMHRLDRETAGVLVFVVPPASRNAYQALLRERRVHKVYEAVAPWRADLVLPRLLSHRIEARDGPAFMQMRVVPGEPNAHTRLELLERLPAQADGPDMPLAHYRLTPLTGRRHQLRVQLDALGLAIVGDRIYPVLLPEPADNAVLQHGPPLQLLSREIAFTDPLSGLPRRFVSRRRLMLAAASAPGRQTVAKSSLSTIPAPPAPPRQAGDTLALTHGDPDHDDPAAHHHLHPDR